MLSDMRGYCLKLLPYRDTGTFVIHSTEDLYEMIDDQLVTLQTMFSSPFIHNFLDTATLWKARVQGIRQTLDAWWDCQVWGTQMSQIAFNKKKKNYQQNHWVYFNTVFNSRDMQRALLAEAKRFLIVDTNWRTIMEKSFA